VSESAASPADAGVRTLGTASGRVVHVESMTVVKSLLVAPMRLVCESAAAPVSSARLQVEIVAVGAVSVTVSGGGAGALLLIAARIGRAVRVTHGIARLRDRLVTRSLLIFARHTHHVLEWPAISGMPFAFTVRRPTAGGETCRTNLTIRCRAAPHHRPVEG
jgi:hypothetical protein